MWFALALTLLQASPPAPAVDDEDLHRTVADYVGGGRAIKEELENVRIDRRGKLATAWADFVMTEEGKESRGKLVLLLVAERGEWKVQALLFAYDGD